MKNTIQKVLSCIAILSLIAGFSANAANTALDSTAAYSADLVTITVAGKDFSASWEEISTVKLTNSNGVDVPLVGSTTNANGSFTVDAASLTKDIYAVSFVTTDGDFGSATFVVDSANTIDVTANVLPILAMNVSGGAVSFGDLVANELKSGSVTTAVKVNTNAANGYTLQVANAGLKDGSNEIVAADTAWEDLNSGFGYGINASVDTGASIDVLNSAAASIDANFNGTDGTKVAGMGGAKNLTTAAGPVSDQTTTVNYYTRVSALQATGNYSDVITYSITGSF